MVPTAPISTTILPAAAWSFFTSSACTSSRSSQRVRGSMRPMIPKSKNTMRPWSSTYRLPACRSPWNRPCRSPPSNRLNSSALTSSVPSNPALRMAAASSMRMPCTRSIVSTRSLVKSQYTCGTRMFLPSGDACRCETQASIDCASRRKFSSSARLSEKSATTSCADSRRPSLASSTAWAKRLRICRSAATRRRMPGRWILTTTSSPAVQGGVVHLGDGRRRERLFFEAGEQLRRVAAELLGEQLVHLVGVGGRHPVEQAAEFAGQRLAERAGAGRDDLPELDVRRPQVGEGLRELLDHLLLPRALARQLGEDASGGAGDLPTGDGRPGPLRPATAPGQAWPPRGVW